LLMKSLTTFLDRAADQIRCDCDCEAVTLVQNNSSVLHSLGI